MAKRLTDIEKKKIVADYVVCGNYKETARKNNVSDTTVRKLVAADETIIQKAEEKNAENTADILAHMDAQKEEVCKLLDDYLSALRNPEKIKKAGVLQLATAMGIIIDKYTATAQNEQAIKKLDEVLGKIGGVI